MYAIIQEGGRQYRVTSGDRLRIDRPPEPDQKTITFDQVLFVGGEGKPRIGAPLVKGATVTATVHGQIKAKKVVTQKYKRRKGYHRKIGHRQRYLDVQITAITV
jgi:large subunit ribosomal protein L21